MNTLPADNQPVALSLREILAFRGIESSYDPKRARERLEVFRADSSTPIPGIEVTYLELDPTLWEQVA